MKKYLILAIDTSCDETAAAVTVNDRILANVISSQIEIHKKWGGVVPNLAKRAHQKMIKPVIKQALGKAKTNLNKLNAVAVTYGPGLAPSLEVGVAEAKKMALKNKKKLIAVNHMEGHLLSSFAKNSQGKGPFGQTKPQFPLLGLLVSGGHTQLVLMKGFGRYQLLGETLDDAAGEAFDKVAKMMGLGYPGGPVLSRLAQKGEAKFALPVPMKNSQDLNFSFSGLKTACLYKLKGLKKEGTKFDQQFYQNFAASFEKAAVEALTSKLVKAIEATNPKQIVLGGEVINNSQLREKVKKSAAEYGLKVFFSNDPRLLSDNAAMIGICAWYQAQRRDFVEKIEELDRQPSLNFSSSLLLPRCQDHSTPGV